MDHHESSFRFKFVRVSRPGFNYVDAKQISFWNYRLSFGVSSNWDHNNFIWNADSMLHMNCFGFKSEFFEK